MASCAGSFGLAGGSGGGTAESGVPEALAFDDGDREGGDGPSVLRLALVEPDTVVPSRVPLLDQSAVVVSDLLYDGLTEIDGTDGDLRPALALRWEPSSDLTRWRFEIDGARTTAEVVATHFEQLLSAPPGSLAPTTSQLLAVIETVEVSTPSSEGDGPESVGAGVRIVTEPGRVPLVESRDQRAASGGAVTFLLRRPEGGLPWLLSGLGLSVVDRDGGPTGRFRTEVAADDTLHLARTRLDSASGTAGGFDRVEIRWGSDVDATYDALTLGLVDGAVVGADALDDASRRFGHQAVPRSATVFYGVQLDGVLTAEVDAARRAELRRAVVAAVGSETRELAAEVLGGLAIDGLLAPGLAGFEDRPGSPPEPGEGAALTDLLADTTLAGAGIELPVTYTDPVHEIPARTVARDLTAGGLVARGEQLPPEVQAEAIAERAPGLFAFGWVAAAGSIDAVVPLLLSSTSPANVLGFDSPEIDDVLARAARTVDDEQRWALLRQAHDQALADGRLVPVAAPFGRLVTAPQKGDLAVRADGSLDLGPGD